MIRELSEQLQRSLLAQPESGMGYQLVESTYRDGTRARMLALNATYLAADWQEVQKSVGSSRLLMERRLHLAAVEAVAKAVSAPEILSLRVVTSTPAVQEGVRKAATGPASDAPETESQEGNEFRRFSAFENDRRVTSEGGLLPGTYATTAEDAQHVQTGEQAVRRYALPNPTPACHELVILPPEKTRIKEGIAQPAYGQPGGGVEILFVAGSPAKTVARGRILPER